MSECTRSEIRDQLPDYVNATLSAAARAAVEAHVASCASCRADVILLKAARGAMLRRAPAVNVSRISAAVREAGAPARGASRARPVEQLRWALTWKAAAAALLFAGAAYAGYALRGTGNTVRVPEVAHNPVTAPVPPDPALGTPPANTPPLHVANVPKTIPAPLPAPPPTPRTIGLSFGGVEQLSPAQAAAMMKELDQAAPTLDANPEAEIALEIGS